MADSFRQSTLQGWKLTVESPRRLVPADIAIPLGVITGELLMNCAKYAYPAGGEVREVSVSVRQGDGRLRLSVRDRGAGLPPGFCLTARHGLGMQVVNALARQLSGSVTADNASPGARFTVTLPLPPDSAA